MSPRTESIPADAATSERFFCSFARSGATIFINSHLLTELESVCDRVAILVGGRVARQGSVDELTVTRQFYLFELETPAWSAVAGAFPGDSMAPPVAGQPRAGNFPIKPGVNSTELSSESARPMPLMSSLRSTLCAGPG